MSASSAVVSVRQHLGHGLGASEIAAALGLSRWKKPITLWLEKTGRQQPTPSQEPAYWGTRLEPIVRAEYVERHGVEVHVPQKSEYHPTVAWARATVDGYVMRPSALDASVLARSHVLECKTVGLRLADDWGEEGKEEVPDYYYTQAVWQMFVTGLPRTDFAVLLGGQRYFEVEVHHDAELESQVYEGAVEFMRHVEADIPPPVDESDAYSEYLRKRIQQSETIVKATPDADRLAVRWQEIAQNLKRLEKDEKLVRNQLLEKCLALGCSKLDTSVGKIAVSTPGAKNARDYEALARDLANRLQLRGEAVDFDAEIAKRTTTTPTDGSLRRPNNWTKGI